MVGRFLERDLMVVFRVRDKRDMGNDYGPIAAEVMREWEEYFGAQPPCTGDWTSAYLTGDHYDIDSEESDTNF
jgi:hypothetical protein